MQSPADPVEDRRKPVTVDQAFAVRLRQARKARGWTQEELAATVRTSGFGMERATIARLERGQRKAKIDEMVALAASLDVSPLYMISPARLETQIQLTPNRSVETFAFLRWARGDDPLETRNQDTYRFMAPGAWVVWEPGDPSTLKHGSGYTRDEALDDVLTLERQDREKERGNDA